MIAQFSRAYAYLPNKRLKMNGFVMKALSSRSAIALLLLALVGSHAVGQEEIRWAPDIDSAKRASAQFKVPLLVHFYGDNCLPCRTLEERVYTKPELIQTLNKYFICVKINATQSPNVASEYGVHSWPSDVFLSPDGEALFQGVCQQDLTGYLSTLQSVAVRNRDRNLMVAAQQQTQAANQQVAGTANLNSHSMFAAGTNGATANAVQNAAQQIQSNLNTSAQQTSQATMDQLATARQMLAAQANTLQGNAQNAAANAQESVAQQTARASAQLHESVQSTVHGLAAKADAFHPRNQSTEMAMPPLPDVTTGPLAMGSQPKSITAAISEQATQVVGNATPVSNNVNGQLPPPASVGQTRGPISPTAGRGTAPMQSFAAMPTMNTNVTGKPSAVVPTFKTASTSVSVQDSQRVSNPFYNESNANGAAMGGDVQNSLMQSTTDLAEATQLESPSDTASPSAGTRAVPAKLASTQLKPSQLDLTSSTSDANAGKIQPEDIQVEEKPAAKSVVDVMAETVDSAVSQSKSAPALEGYCPVALSSESQWVEGDPKFAVKHRGKVYWMSSQSAMDTFLAKPDASAPILSGYDPLILLEEGRLVEGSIQYGLHEQVSGTYLLFTSAEGKQKYWNDFDRYSKALKALLLKASEK